MFDCLGTPHGSHFTRDCNDCICHAGESVCTRRQCAVTANYQQFTGKHNFYYATMNIMKILPICGRFDDKVCLFVLPNWLPYTVVLIEITFRLVIMFYPLPDLCG